MTRLVIECEISDRLRQLIGKHFQRRGKFNILEQQSTISGSKWKNFYYRKQDASTSMIEFWCNKFPDDEDWLRTGAKILNGAENPFSMPIPAWQQRQTLRDRLKWVISEWCSQAGTRLFQFLESKSAGKIHAIEWLDMMLGTKPPTADMIEFVCSKRPHFTCWIICGAKYPKQVSPENADSIRAWLNEKSKKT